MRVELFLAWRYLFRGQAHHISFISIIACAGIVLGVATLVIVTSVMNGFDRDLASKLLSFNHHLVIESFNQKRLYEIKKDITEIKDVQSASIYAHTQVFCEFDEYIMPVVVKGIDFSDRAERELFYSFVQEEYGEAGFFVGEGLRRKFFIEDMLSFYPLHKKLKLKEAPVRGVFKIGLYDLDNNYIIGGVTEIMNLGEHYALFLGVRIKKPFEADKVKREIEKRHPSLIINTWIDINRVLFSALKLEKITMFVILSLIILVATFSIFSILMVKVMEKIKEIGIVRAVGFTSRHVLSVFTLQGLILGVIGTVIGLGAGVLVCFLLKEYHFIQIPKEIYYIDYLPVYVSYRDLIIISGVSIILSLCASIIPARRASRLSICEALRYE